LVATPWPPFQRALTRCFFVTGNHPVPHFADKASGRIAPESERLDARRNTRRIRRSGPRQNRDPDWYLPDLLPGHQKHCSMLVSQYSRLSQASAIQSQNSTPKAM
jgi:hypothetical protein